MLLWKLQQTCFHPLSAVALAHGPLYSLWKWGTSAPPQCLPEPIKCCLVRLCLSHYADRQRNANLYFELTLFWRQTCWRKEGGGVRGVMMERLSERGRGRRQMDGAAGQYFMSDCAACQWARSRSVCRCCTYSSVCEMCVCVCVCIPTVRLIQPN